MTDASTAPFAASLLKGSGPALAAFAAEELLASHAEMARRYGDKALVLWKQNLQSRIEHLAAALSLGKKELFASHVSWSRIAFQARQVDPAEIRHGLEALQRVLDQELPLAAAMVAREYVQHGITVVSAEDGTVATLHLDPKDAKLRLAASYLAAVFDGERDRACSILLTAVEKGTSVKDIYRNVLIPVQAEVGRLWHVGEVGVATEHFTTTTTEHVMARLLPLHPRKASNGKTMVAASVGGNAHSIGLRIITDFFAMEGWRPIDLGGDVPRSDLVESLHDFGADLLALSATLATHLDETRQVVAAVRADAKVGSIPVIVGGGAFHDIPTLAREIGADGYALDPDEAVEVGERLTAKG
jgi:methanogenic corrinoid protein MtbC1